MLSSDSLQGVALAAQEVDRHLCAAFCQLCVQSGDGGVKRGTVACQGAAPDALVKVLLRDDLPAILGKLQQQGEFLLRQR